MLPLIVALTIHVPQYDGCDHNCCHPPHDPTTSQVAYLKGSGGIQYDIDEIKGEFLYYQVVFKKPYDVSTFSVYAGCGGCASDPVHHFDQPLTLPIQQQKTYPNPKFEPFTQHSYYPLLSEGSTELQIRTDSLENCSSHHVSVRIIVHANATEELVWGAVVGCPNLSCERYTLLEMLSFPIYIIRNHGPAWNDAAWTLLLICATTSLVVGLVLLCTFSDPWMAFKAPPRIAYYTKSNANAEAEVVVNWRDSTQLVFYALATWAMVVDILETLAHTLIAAQVVPAGDDGYTTMVSLLAYKFLLLAWPVASWSFERAAPFPLQMVDIWDYCKGWAWSLVDFFIATVSLLSGSGFYAYPVALSIAGFIRIWELVQITKYERLSSETDQYPNKQTNPPLQTNASSNMPTIVVSNN